MQSRWDNFLLATIIMDFVKTAVSYITFQRFYRYLLKRILSGFISPDFSTDQLEIQLFKGEVHLVDAEVDPRKLNELFNEADLPFRVESGTVDRIRIQIPWTNILEDKCKVYISGVRFRVRMCKRGQEENDPSGVPQSPRESSNTMSESARSLTRLVRQVLMNVEGCLEDVSIRLCSPHADVSLSYHVSRVLIHQGENKTKRFMLGPTSLIAESSIPSFQRIQLMTSYPGSFALNILNPEIVSLTGELSGIFVHLDSPESFQLLSQFVQNNTSVVVEEPEFFPACEPEGDLVIDSIPSQLPNFRKRPWYEEMYSIVESEVLGSTPTREESTTLPDLVLEEPLEATQVARKFNFQLTLTTCTIQILDLHIQLNNLNMSYMQDDPLPISITADQYLVGICSDDETDSVSLNSFDSAVEVDDTEIDIETLLFDTKRTCNLELSSNPPIEQPEEAFIVFISSFTTQSLSCTIDSKSSFNLDLLQKIQISLSPEIIVNVQTLLDRLGTIFSIIIPRQDGSDQRPFRLTITQGVEVSCDLGNGHTLKLECVGPIIFDPLEDNDIVRIVNGLELSTDSYRGIARTVGDVCIRQITTVPEPVIISSESVMENQNFESEWTSLSVPSSSIMRQLFGNRKSFSSSSSRDVRNRTETTETAKKKIVSDETENRNIANKSAQKILESCSQTRQREFVVLFDEILVATESVNGIEFVDLQLKLQSFIDQLSIARERVSGTIPTSGEENDGVPGISVLIDSLLVGPFVQISQVGVRLLPGMIGAIARNTTVSNLCHSANPTISPDVQNLHERFVNSPEAVTMTIEIIPLMSSTNSSRISAMVGIKGLYSSFSPSEQFMDECLKIYNWFAPPLDFSVPGAPLITAPPRPTYTVYIVRLEQSVIEWCNESAALYIDKLEMSSGILSTVDAKKTFSGVSVQEGKIGLWLANQKWTDSESCSLMKLKQNGYRQLVSVSDCGAMIKGKEGRNFLDFKIGAVRMDIKPDSYVSLVTFVEKVCGMIGAMVKRRTATAQAVAPSVFTTTPSHEFEFKIKEDFLSSKFRSGRGGSRFAKESSHSSWQPPVSVGTARWLVDPASVNVVYDHLVSSTSKNKSNMASRKALTKAEDLTRTDENFSLASITISIESFRLFLMDGLDWSGNEYHLSGLGSRSSTQSSPSLICIEIDHLDTTIISTQRSFDSTTVVEDKIFVDLAATAEDIRIRDGVVGSVYQCVLSPIIFEEDSSGGDSLFVHFTSCGEGESLIRKCEIAIQPISLFLDQDTLDFVQKFLRDTTVAGIEEDGLSCFSQNSVSEDHSPIMKPASPLFQSLSISSISAEVNYRSKRLSLSRLRRGDVLEFLNIVPMIEGVRLNLREVRLVDVPDGSELGKRLIDFWSLDVKKSKLLKTIGNVAPVRSFTNLGAGVCELLNQPRKQMRRKDGNLGRGVLRGVSMFIKTLTIESLNLMDTVVSSAQGALELAGGGTSQSSSRPLHQPSSDSDEGEEDIEDEIFEWTSVEKGARERELDPSSAMEGLYSGGDALVRGVRGGIIRGESGVSGYILKPAIGATQAVSVVLRGARSTLDSGKHRAETERKYKAPYTQDEMLGN